MKQRAPSHHLPSINVAAGERRTVSRPEATVVPIDSGQRPLTAMYRGRHYRLAAWVGGLTFKDADGHQWMDVADFLRNHWTLVAEPSRRA